MDSGSAEGRSYVDEERNGDPPVVREARLRLFEGPCFKALSQGEPFVLRLFSDGSQPAQVISTNARVERETTRSKESGDRRLRTSDFAVAEALEDTHAVSEVNSKKHWVSRCLMQRQIRSM